MKGFILGVIVVIAVVVVLGSTVAHDVISEMGIDIGGDDSNPIGKIFGKASEITSSGSSSSRSPPKG